MDIVVVGRHTEISDRFREHAEEKLGKITQLAPLAQRVDVEVTEEKNPKLAAQRERVELTVVAKGPVVRAEAAADDRYGALDLAIDKLLEQLRRQRDRRKDHRRTYVLSPTLPPTLEPVAAAAPPAAVAVKRELVADGDAVETQMGDSPVMIRQKLHTAAPMSVDEAIEAMEMVGHDFYLFVDADTMRPSAAYKRKGWTYGVIQLDQHVER
ncbi:MAG: ribosome-associated translation inhibitor RaiA [Promicromonosporaceae bacterium]|nr:ribosome-associated translation inhibitor RaiA [Promicromonosporaceae bacterium]